MRNIGWDTETHLIGAPHDIIPPLVCSTTDMGEGEQDTHIEAVADGRMLQHLLDLWQGAYERKHRIIIQNAAFDITVALRYAQENADAPGSLGKDLFLTIWDVLDTSLDDEWATWADSNAIGPGATKGAAGRSPVIVSDTIIRQKLYNLSKHGNMEFYGTEESNIPIRYDLASLVKHYFKIDISDAKISTDKDGRIYDANGVDITGTPQAAAAWRLRYSELAQVPIAQWPREAIDYAIQDATWARRIWEAQEAKRQPDSWGSMNSEALQVYADVAFRIATSNGFRVDGAQIKRLEQRIGTVAQSLEPHLIASGIIRSNGSRNMGVVKAYCEETWALLGREPLLTESGEIATGKEVLDVLTAYDPRLAIYHEYMQMAKIRDAFLPRLRGDRVFTDFDILKDTGRASSRGSSDKAGRKPLYDAVNSQQIPRKAGVREAFLGPEDAPIIASVDYSALELCSVAETTYRLFGYSVHRDKIAQGYDLHSFLGSGLAMVKNPLVVDEWVMDHEKAYQAMIAHLKADIPQGDDSPEAEHRRKLKKLAKKFRNFAKPVGLGYPGGLGKVTMVVFAKTTYGVVMTEQEADEFKQLWFRIYPEMVDYFAWVGHQQDRVNSGGSDRTYCYTTDGFNRFRAGATFCAVSNGKAMQSLSADGAKRAVCWLGRACAGGIPAGHPWNILSDCRMLTFIHDEALIGMPNDGLLTERALVIQDVMNTAMSMHMPNTRISTEPALMTRWIKAAEPVWTNPDNPRYAGSIITAAEALNQIGQRYDEATATAVGEIRDKLLGGAGAGHDKTNRRLIPWDWANDVPGITDEGVLA